MGAGSEALARGAGTFGVIVVAAVMVVMLGGLFLASRKTKVSHHNVNEEWHDKLGGVPAPRVAERTAVPA